MEKMTLSEARAAIWVPDALGPAAIIEAALTVLETRGAASADVYQATYLITARRRRA
jgi:hypothetical protein